MATKTKRIDPSHAPTPANPEIDAIGVSALAKSQKADAHRDLLKPGFYTVALTVDGTVDGQRWNRAVNGTLTVGMDSGPVAASSTPWADLLQSALCGLTETKRRAFLATVAAGEVPLAECGPEKVSAVAAEIEPALKSYRATKAAPKRGNVAFVPTIVPKGN